MANIPQSLDTVLDNIFRDGKVHVVVQGDLATACGLPAISNQAPPDVLTELLVCDACTSAILLMFAKSNVVVPGPIQ